MSTLEIIFTVLGSWMAIGVITVCAMLRAAKEPAPAPTAPSKAHLRLVPREPTLYDHEAKGWLP